MRGPAEEGRGVLLGWTLPCRQVADRWIHTSHRMNGLRGSPETGWWRKTDRWGEVGQEGGTGTGEGVQDPDPSWYVGSPRDLVIRKVRVSE